MHFDRMAYGERIKRLRTGRELTQEQLAEKINVSRTYIVKIENGLQIGPIEIAIELAMFFDVLQRVCRDNAIHMESNWTPVYNSAYVEGINNLYEFDVGSLSGWMYNVNGWYPNYGCSRYQLKDGDVVEWCYTCDLGYDLGSAMGG